MIRASFIKTTGDVELRVFGSLDAMFTYATEIRNELKRLNWRTIK